MFAELYCYLVTHQQLSLPGIGTFFMEREPAVASFPNKRMAPPSYHFRLDEKEQTPPMSFYKWLSHTLSTSNHEAVTQFNDFVFDLKNKIIYGHTVIWHDLGTLQKGLNNTIKFQPKENIIFEEPVIAEKIIRSNATHTVKVGEQEKTSDEMNAALRPVKKERNWLMPLAISLCVLGILFLGWYFFQHGFTIQAMANQKQLEPLSPTTGFRILP